MNYYFAPMEGITGFIYRNIHHKYFGGIDKYFAPFITPNESKKVMTKELRDVFLENNPGICLVPQILTNRADRFIDTARKLRQLGYSEVNLNLGCPSATVTAKAKGSGFLAFPEALEQFFDEVFECLDMDVSVKTRLGRDDPEEFYRLLDIYNRYPIKELIIHPRIREDFYNGRPRMDYFSYAAEHSKNPLCYNGDLRSAGDIAQFCAQYPGVDKVMIGRGLLMYPGLVAGLKAASTQAMMCRKVMDFHNELYDAYRTAISGERNVLFKMKELWFYLIAGFPGNEKNFKKLRKARRLAEYESAVRQIFASAEI